MDEPPLTGQGIVIAEEIAVVAAGIAVCALEDGQGERAVLMHQAGNSGGIVGGIGLKAADSQGLGKDLALENAVRTVSVWSPLVTTVSPVFST